MAVILTSLGIKKPDHKHPNWHLDLNDNWDKIDYLVLNLDAGNLTAGVIPDARFPNILPAVSGANLTNLDASNMTQGTIPSGRFPAILPAVSGANLTSLHAAALASGEIPDERLAANILRKDAASNSLTGDLVIQGALILNGSTTTVNSTVMDVADRIIHVNHTEGPDAPIPTGPAGVAVHRGDVAGVARNHAAVVWDEANSRWVLTQTDHDDNIITDSEQDLRLRSLVAHGGTVEIAQAANTNRGLGLSVIGDTNYRFVARVDGHLSWGVGSGSRTVTLYMNGADGLKTDNVFDAKALSVGGATVIDESRNVLLGGTLSTANGTAMHLHAGGLMHLHASSYSFNSQDGNTGWASLTSTGLSMATGTVIQMAGTTVIDANRNLTNIGTATLSGNLTLGSSANIEMHTSRAINWGTLTSLHRSNGNDFQMSHYGSIMMLIDADSNDTSRIFSVRKDSADPTTAVELFRVTEAGNMYLTMGAPSQQVNSSSGSSFSADDRLFQISGTNSSIVSLARSGDVDGQVLGGLWFTRTDGQADHHKNVAAVRSKQVGTGSLAGANLEFIVKSSAAPFVGATLSASATATSLLTMQGSINIANSGGLQIGGTAIIDSSRNLSNLGNITAVGVTTITSGNGDIFNVRTGNAGTPGAITLGRTGVDFKLGIAGAGAHYVTSSVQGDVVFRIDDATKRMIFAFGTATNAQRLELSSSAVNVVGGAVLQVGGTTVINASRHISAPMLAVSSTTSDLTAGAPWYGIGHSNIVIGSPTVESSTAVQVAGFFGLRMRSNGVILDLHQQQATGAELNATLNITNGGLSIAGTSVIDASRNVTGLNVTGRTVIAESVYTGYTQNSGASLANYWFPVATVSLTEQFQFGMLQMDIAQAGNSGNPNTDRFATIHLKVKQQAAMGSAPVIDIDMPFSSGLNPSEVKFVLTENSTSKTEGTLYVRMNVTHDYWIYTIKNRFGSGATITRFINANGLAALPAGTQVGPLPHILASSASSTVTFGGQMVIMPNIGPAGDTGAASALLFRDNGANNKEYILCHDSIEQPGTFYFVADREIPLDGTAPEANGIIKCGSVVNTEANREETATISTNTALAATAKPVMFANASAGAVTITLPTASASTVGRKYRIYKTDSSVNAVTVAATTNQFIRGVSSISTQWQALDIIQFSSTEWIVRAI